MLDAAGFSLRPIGGNASLAPRRCVHNSLFFVAGNVWTLIRRSRAILACLALEHLIHSRHMPHAWPALLDQQIEGAVLWPSDPKARHLGASAPFDPVGENRARRLRLAHDVTITGYDAATRALPGAGNGGWCATARQP